MHERLALLAGVSGGLLGGFTAGLYTRSRLRRMPFVGRQDRFSIGIYTGSDPLHLTDSASVQNPVLTAADVADVTAAFVADPFMVQERGRWHMFFEVLERRTARGSIGLATSDDGLRWRYEQIVLREPFHLSYPYVFTWDHEYYMIPETAEDGSVRLYRAQRFPTEWVLSRVLLRGCLVDSSIFRHAGAWWMFSADHGDVLRLFVAAEIAGPWREHPRSPLIVGSSSTARPGGRVLAFDDGLVRLAQDDLPYYGNALRAFVVDELSPSEYREHEVAGGPLLKGSGRGWNARGMHHLDAHQLGPGEWIACVDGLTRTFRLRR